MYRRGVLRTFVALAFATACAPATAQQPPAAPDRATPDSWELTLHLSGGFAGLDRTLELLGTGVMRGIDRKRSAQIAAQATDQERARIASLVSALKSGATARSTECRDCLEYTLNIRRGSERFVFELDDSSLAQSSVEPLVNVLVTALNRALAGNGR